MIDSNLTRQRALVGASIALLAIWYLLPELVSTNDPRMEALLGMTGYGAALSANQLRMLSLLLLFTNVLGLLGIWMQRTWGRWLLLASAVGFLVLGPVSGVAIEPAVGAPFGYLLTLCQGALLAHTFSSRDEAAS